MKRATCLVFGILAAICALGVDVGQVRAQPSGAPGALPPSGPIYSPYLNLLRNSGSPTLNYFGLVRPQLNFMNSLNGLQQQVGNEQQAIGDLQGGNLPTTGHPAMFLNTRGYFQGIGGGMGGGIGMQGMQRTQGTQGMPALSQGGLGGSLGPTLPFIR